jgi:hypothetical protein
MVIGVWVLRSLRDRSTSALGQCYVRVTRPVRHVGLRSIGECVHRREP